MKTPKTYIKELKKGKQLRIKYDKRQLDSSGNWWSEELICYDSNIDMFKIYFLQSSYDDQYCDYILEDSLMSKLFLETMNYKAWLNRDNRDEEYEDAIETIDMILEKCNIPNTSLSFKELIDEKLDYFTNDELRYILTYI